MTPSQNCIELVKRFEGCKLEAYLCPAGVWTIGAGHTGPEVKQGMKISQGIADALLLKDLTHAADAVERAVKVELTQGQFDALVSFVFNVGKTAFETSTMLKKINGGDFLGAAMEFPKWCNGGGKKLEGLVRRRAAEQAMFELG